MGKEGKFATWIALMSIYTMMTIALMSPTAISNSILKEIENIYLVFGVEDGKEIVLFAQKIVDTIFFDSGFFESAKEKFFPVEYREKGTVTDNEFFRTEYFNWIESVILNMIGIVEITLIRVFSTTPWLPFFFIISCVGFAHGYYKRQIKQHGFDYSSPLRYGIALNILYFIFPLFYIYFTLPISVSPLVLPVLMCVFALILSQIVSNTIKRI